MGIAHIFIFFEMSIVGDFLLDILKSAALLDEILFLIYLF
jgi:hypothetical protein